MELLKPYGNNPGRIIGGVTLGQTGPLSAGGGAFEFNGSTGLVGTQRSFANPQKLSIVFWIKPNSITGGVLGLNDIPFTSSFGYTYVYFLSYPLLGFTPNNTAPGGVASNAVPAVGVWTMVTVLSNGQGYSLELNDSYQLPGTGQPGLTPYTGWWTLGNFGSSDAYDSTGNWLDGSLSEVAVFHGTLLTQAQINAIYGASSSSDPNAYPAAVMAAKPTSYWRLNETSGLWVHDEVLR